MEVKTLGVLATLILVTLLYFSPLFKKKESQNMKLEGDYSQALFRYMENPQSTELRNILEECAGSWGKHKNKTETEIAMMIEKDSKGIYKKA